MTRELIGCNNHRKTTRHLTFSMWEAGKPGDGGELHLDSLAMCLFEVFAEHSSAWLPGQMGGIVQRREFVPEQASRTADVDKLDKPVSYKVGVLYYSH